MPTMDEEQRYERLDADNDYEGLEWIGGEAFFQAKRQKRQQTKEDQLYGVFADSDSDSEGRRARRGGGGGPKDYSKPVGFVSSGIVGKQQDEDGQQQQQQQGMEEDEQQRPSFDVRGPPDMGQEGTGGLGAGAAGPSGRGGGGGGGGGGSGGGLGFRSGGKQEEDDEEEHGVLSTALGARIKQRVAEKRKTERQEKQAEQKRQQARSADPQFAAFEKFTKGIGMKLLMKMGYKPGEGLGKDKAGIAKPIEVKQRQKGQALGFGVRHRDDEWEEERAKGAGQSADVGPGAKPDQKDQRGPSGGMWKKRHAEARVKREYRTADEVVRATADRPGGTAGVQPILDMRGPQVRLVTNLEHLNAAQPAEGAGGESKPMPELQHNLQLLVDMCEADIQKLDAKLRHEQDTATLVARERERLLQVERRQQEELERLEKVMELVRSCQPAAGGAGGRGGAAAAAAAAPGLEKLEEVYRQLAASYREEYVLYNLAPTAAVQVLPAMQRLLQGWSPLAEPSRGVAELRRWRPLLEPPSGPGGSRGPAGEDPYLTLVVELVLPPLRSACTAWQPREPEPLLQFLEAWEPALPPAALDNVLQMLVMPRLRSAVQEWEPRQETVPIHRWLHPWLTYLGSQLEELYPSIRHKLSVALQAWHASDGSALALLQPWWRVFSPADWTQMLVKSIIPKLAFALQQQLVIDPSNQDMSPFLWVMAWADVMPLQHMVSLLEHSFFPKWHQVLHFWLSHTPNYDEVTRWYLGWKSYFPPQLLDHERVRHQFNLALDAMNTAVEGHVPAAAAAAAAAAGPAAAAAAAGGQVPFATRWAADGAGAGAAAAAAAAPMATAAPAAAELTLRDLVQRFAEEHSVSFMPKFGRFHDGLQVYSFGGISVVLENATSVVRAQLRDRWAPVSLDTLLQQARLLST